MYWLFGLIVYIGWFPQQTNVCVALYGHKLRVDIGKLVDIHYYWCGWAHNTTIISSKQEFWFIHKTKQKIVYQPNQFSAPLQRIIFWMWSVQRKSTNLMILVDRFQVIQI